MSETDARTNKKKRLILAYKRMFLDDKGQLNEDGKIVLADLMQFTRFYQSPMVVSPSTQATDVPASFSLMGRREVTCRIMDHLHVNDSALFMLQKEVKDD